MTDDKKPDRTTIPLPDGSEFFIEKPRRRQRGGGLEIRIGVRDSTAPEPEPKESDEKAN